MNNLTVLSGQVNNLKVERATKDFFKSKVSGKIAEAGAFGAAALGELAASTALANYRLNSSDSVEYFTCTVNGIKLAGCFETVTFMERNEIEFVVEYTNEDKTEALVHGARDHKRKVMWVVPYQQYGEVAHKRARDKDAKQISTVFTVLFISVMLGIYFYNGASSTAFLTASIIVALAGGSGVYLLIYLGYRKTFPHSQRGTKVFAAMGYENPAEVNMIENDFLAQQEWDKKNGKRVVIPHLWVYRF